MTSDFTETNYRSLLETARKHYAFCDYFDRPNGRHIIWRHDVDFSVHRALRLAEIEFEMGIRSTFFIQITSSFYNIFENEIRKKIEAIQKLGHEIGLHFDTDGFALQSGDFGELLQWQKKFVEKVAGPIRVFSFHNPAHSLVDVEADFIQGMLNVYGRSIREQYKYCSDSNGYWRYDHLGELLAAAKFERLHVLTHPEWWTDERMTPRERVLRCVNGRALRVMKKYDNDLESFGRPNIGKPPEESGK